MFFGVSIFDKNLFLKFDFYNYNAVFNATMVNYVVF